MANTSDSLPVVLSNVVSLAIAELIIYAILLIPAVWIIWRHGKPGIMAWPLFVSFIGLRFVADINQIMQRNEPLVPGSTIYKVTSAGSVTCLTLMLIGVVYEVNTLIPYPGKPWLYRLLLGAGHLVNLAGIGLFTYGSDLTPTGEMRSPTVSRIGNCLQLVVLLGIVCCTGLTYLRVRSITDDSMQRSALWMIWAVVGATLLQIVRLAYATTYAFTPITSLDPVTGAFVVKLVLIFGTQLVISLTLTFGGWFGISLSTKPISC